MILPSFWMQLGDQQSEPQQYLIIDKRKRKSDSHPWKILLHSSRLSFVIIFDKFRCRMSRHMVARSPFLCFLQHKHVPNQHNPFMVS